MYSESVFLGNLVEFRAGVSVQWIPRAPRMHPGCRIEKKFTVNWLTILKAFLSSLALNFASITQAHLTDSPACKLCACPNVNCGEYNDGNPLWRQCSTRLPWCMVSPTVCSLKVELTSYCFLSVKTSHQNNVHCFPPHGWITMMAN